VVMLRTPDNARTLARGLPAHDGATLAHILKTGPHAGGIIGDIVTAEDKRLSGGDVARMERMKSGKATMQTGHTGHNSGRSDDPAMRLAPSGLRARFLSLAPLLRGRG